MNKQSKLILLSSVIFFAVFCLITVLLSSIFFSDVEGITLWITLIESVGLVVTILVAVVQFGESKEISRAEFIVQLNSSFIENQDYIAVYNALQSCVDGNGDECEISFDKSVVSNYLTFFETVYILYKRGVISFDIIDDLFAYRFFLAVHSEAFQREKLMPQPENFKNIFKLEHEWLKYRVKIGKNDAQRIKAATEEYRNYLETKENPPKWDNVYEMRLLRGIVSEEKYKELLRG